MGILRRIEWITAPINGDDLSWSQLHDGGQGLRGSGAAQSSRKACASASAAMCSETALLWDRMRSRSASIAQALLLTCTRFLPPSCRRRTENGVSSY